VLAREYETAVQFDLSAEGVVRIDRTRIVQALLILVDNAAKYSPADATITLRSAQQEGEIVVEVTDRGPGIPAEDLPLIFERFYRVDKARTRKIGGAGLGLAIAKSIITAHGGRIAAESAVNHGTTMRLHLPLAAIPQTTLTPVKQLVVRDAV
jgi:two-component system sensor histidine kinase VicK